MEVLDGLIRQLVSIDDSQFGFVPGRGKTDAIFVVGQLQDKYLAPKMRLYMAFIDLEKAFDQVPQKVIKWAPRKLGVEEWIVRLVQGMYANVQSPVRVVEGYSEEFEVKVSVHQGSVLSPLLFIIVLEALSLVLLWGALGGPLCRLPCYHRWIIRGMCQKALDLERSNGKERTESKCRKNEDHDLRYGLGPPAEFRQVSICRLLHCSGQQQHLLQWLQALGAQEMQRAQVLDKGPWLQMYMVPGNCTPLGWQTTEGSPSWTWQAGDGSFLLLPRRYALSSRWLWTFNYNTCEKHLEEVQGAATSSLFMPPLFQDTWLCVELLCVERNAPCQWDLAIDKTKPPMSAAEWQGNDQTDLQCQAARRCHHQVQWTTCATWHWGSGPHSEREKAQLVWTCGMLQWSNRRPFTYRLRESLGLGGPRWHGSSWQRGIAESGSSRLSTLMIEICGDLVWDMPCVQQASYLEEGPLMWMLPLYLHVNQNCRWSARVFTVQYCIILNPWPIGHALMTLPFFMSTLTFSSISDS